MEVLGLDIGGMGIKGALVDTESGEMLTERYTAGDGLTLSGTTHEE